MKARFKVRVLHTFFSVLTSAVCFLIIPRGNISYFPKSRDTKLIVRDICLIDLRILKAVRECMCHFFKSSVFAWKTRRRLKFEQSQKNNNRTSDENDDSIVFG